MVTRKVFLMLIAVMLVHCGYGQSVKIIKSVNFDNCTEGYYSVEESERDWGGDYLHYWGIHELEQAQGGYEGDSAIIVKTTSPYNKVLRATFKKGTLANHGGFDFEPDITTVKYEEIYFSYDVFFKEGFEFAAGGKLPGLSGGLFPIIPITPGKYDPEWGWCAVVMWTGEAGLTTFLYYPDQPTEWGESIAFPEFAFKTGQWYNITFRVVMNSSTGADDGIFEIFVNGELVFNKSDLRFKQNPEDNIERTDLVCFFGGNTDAHRCWRDEFVDLDNFVLWQYEAGQDGIPYGNISSSSDRRIIPPLTNNINGWERIPRAQYSDRSYYQDASGTISDGSGLRPYASNLSCEYQIDVPGADSIRVTFNHYCTDGPMSLREDYLTIFQGSSRSDKILADLYGGCLETPFSITAEGSKMLLFFHSDGGLQGSGWELEYMSFKGGYSMAEGIPQDPVNLRAGEVTENSIKLIWDDMADNEYYYHIECKTDEETQFEEIIKLQTNSTSYTVTGLIPSSKYSFRVRASNINGLSEYSEIVDISTLDIVKTESNVAPRVSDQKFTLSSERLESDTIGTIYATDSNKDQVLSYKILSGNEEGIFTLNNKNGNLLLVDKSKLSLFEGHTFTLVVEVSDNGEDRLATTANIRIEIKSKVLTVYIDPSNINDLLEDGSIEHPFDSWQDVKWESGKGYYQKRSSIAFEKKINISASNIAIGAYGEGELPIIRSQAKDFGMRAYERKGILISDLHLIADEAISCIYFLGSSCDSISVSNCVFESSNNGIRIIEGKNFSISYNTFIGCADAIFSFAENNQILYNVFKDNNTAINVNSYLSKAEIFNNVFYNNSFGISASYSELVVYNNIFYLADQSVQALNYNFDKLISDNNIYYPEQEGFLSIKDVNYSSLQEYQSATGLDINSFSQDPQFMDVYNNNFGLKSTSPAIDAGKYVGVLYDFGGSPVPYGNAPDIGLIESKALKGITSGITNNLSDYYGSEDPVIFPNPTDGIFQSIFNYPSKNDLEIIIRDISGRDVYMDRISGNGSSFKTEIDITSQPNGIYLTFFNIDGKSYIQKIIKN